MRDDRARLLDMLEAIERVEKYAAKGRTAFDNGELIQTWVLHHLQIMGGAARGVSEACRARYPQIPWSEIVGTRNILVHQYFGIDKDLVWSVVANNLPKLKADVQQILAGM